MSNLPILRLNAREDRRLRAGHLWVFSNEVDTKATPLKDFAPGDLAVVTDHKGAALGLAYVNPNALICARLLSRRPDTEINADWFRVRLQAALELREQLFSRPFYRLVHAEGDGLPGLIVDRYDDVLVAQFTTAGMEARRADVMGALQGLLQPRGILLRNDSSIRQLEGLPLTVASIGAVPERIEIEEEGARFLVPLAGGQKTGWFFDQRDNRTRLLRYVKGRRLLDVCSYVGAWGVRAALAGAQATCVDSSAAALAAVQANAALNGVRVETREGDALDVLKQLRDANERFDAVVLDPPALIKRKKDFDKGSEYYARMNLLALGLLPAGGLLVSCSCSHHLPTEELLRLVQREARKTGRGLQLLEQGAAAPDHPVHPAIPETAYLKALYFRVTDPT